MIAALTFVHRGDSCPGCACSYGKRVSRKSVAVRYFGKGTRNSRSLEDSFTGSYGSSFTGVNLNLSLARCHRATRSLLFGGSLPNMLGATGDSFTLSRGSDRKRMVVATVKRKGAAMDPCRVTLVTRTITGNKAVVRPCLIRDIAGCANSRVQGGIPGDCGGIVASSRTTRLGRCVATIMRRKAKSILGKESCATTKGAKATRCDVSSKRGARS